MDDEASGIPPPAIVVGLVDRGAVEGIHDGFFAGFDEVDFLDFEDGGAFFVQGIEMDAEDLIEDFQFGRSAVGLVFINGVGIFDRKLRADDEFLELIGEGRKGVAVRIDRVGELDGIDIVAIAAP